MVDPARAEGLECAKCRERLERGDPYYTMRLGMDDEPSHVETGQTLVEDIAELYFCAGCEPAARLMFEGLLTELWNARADDVPTLGADLGREAPTSAYTDESGEPPTLPGLAPKAAEQ